MANVHLIRGQSEESEEDIFRSSFSNANSGKVKIAGATNSHVGLANSKIVGLNNENLAQTEQILEKQDPMKDEEAGLPPVGPRVEDGNGLDTGGNSPVVMQRAQSEQGGDTKISSHTHAQPQSNITSYEDSDLVKEEDEDKDGFIEIIVSDPHKVGEGMSSYMAYKVKTRTNLRYFKKSEFTVSRRFSDFLGLHEKLCDKHLSKGRIVPPAPEKSLVATTKVKMSSNNQSSMSEADSNSGTDSKESSPKHSEFIARRRFGLERFINRVAQHPIFRRDYAFIEFLETVRDLPRATSTSALSSASVMRLLGKVGDTVNKMTYRMEENDPWYEEKIQQIDQLENQLKKLHGIVDIIVQYRQELSMATGNFANSVSALAEVEEVHSLSRALSHLAKAEEKVEAVHQQQAESDYFYLYELIRDYVSLVGAVKAVFAERNKAFQNWRHAQSMVMKKKEQRARLEMGGKSDKMPAANEEVIEWENRLVENQDNFNKISNVIKNEIDFFERYRVKDFKISFIQYLEALMKCQVEMVKHWEEFLPDVKSVLY